RGGGQASGAAVFRGGCAEQLFRFRRTQHRLGVPPSLTGAGRARHAVGALCCFLGLSAAPRGSGVWRGGRRPGFSSPVTSRERKNSTGFHLPVSSCRVGVATMVPSLHRRASPTTHAWVFSPPLPFRCSCARSSTWPLVRS